MAELNTDLFTPVQVHNPLIPIVPSGQTSGGRRCWRDLKCKYTTAKRSLEVPLHQVWSCRGWVVLRKSFNKIGRCNQFFSRYIKIQEIKTRLSQVWAGSIWEIPFQLAILVQVKISDGAFVNLERPFWSFDLIVFPSISLPGHSVIQICHHEWAIPSLIPLPLS